MHQGKIRYAKKNDDREALSYIQVSILHANRDFRNDCGCQFLWE